ncbi:MAG: RidA family protein [Symploca sp. SIO2D2]|nr:RidA family protein [Symploca sp. SIO2D2]
MLQHLTPETIHPPFANYCHGVVVPEKTRLVFCSGQLGINIEGEIPQDTESQAKLCFESIAAVIKEAGGSLENVVRINAYVTGREHLQPYMKVRDTFFPEKPAPASTLLIVSGFTKEIFKVEIEAIAAIAD